MYLTNTLMLFFFRSFCWTFSVNAFGVMTFPGASIRVLAKFWPVAFDLPACQPTGVELWKKRIVPSDCWCSTGSNVFFPIRAITVGDMIYLYYTHNQRHLTQHTLNWSVQPVRHTDIHLMLIIHTKSKCSLSKMEEPRNQSVTPIYPSASEG